MIVNPLVSSAMDSSDDTHGDRRQGDRRVVERRKDFRGDRNPITVRTDPDHKAILTQMGDLFGLSRNDFFAIVMAAACGLPRPKRAPAVPLSLRRLPELAEAIQAGAEQDVLAALAQDVLRDGVLPKSA